MSIDTIHNAKASANVINFKSNPEILIFHSKKRKIMYICVYVLVEKLLSRYANVLRILCTRQIFFFVVSRYL